MNAYALTTVARFKTYAGISTSDNDTLIEYLIDAVTEYVENECDRRFKKTTYTGQKVDSEGSTKIVLPQWPVVSGETFTLYERESTSGYGSDDSGDWDDIDSDDYRIDYNAGIITANFKFSEGEQNYKVDYTAGYDFENESGTLKTLASVGLSDLEMAVWKLLSREYQKRKGSGDIQRLQLYNYEVVFAKEAYSDDEIREILDKYKRFDF